MIGMGMLVLVVVVIVASLIGAQSLRHNRALEAEMTRFGEQVAVQPRRERRIPLIAEALGYVGGMLGIIGLVLLIGHYWTDMSSGARLALSAAGSVLLITGGWFVREADDAAFARMRWFLWLVGTAALGVAAAVFDDMMWTTRHAPRTALVVAVAVSVASAALWAGRHRPLQQFTLMAGLLVIAGTGASQFSGAAGIGVSVWVVAGALAFMGLTETSIDSGVSCLVGVVGAVVGASITIGDWNGYGMLLLVSTGVISVAIGVFYEALDFNTRGMIFALVGALSLVESIPATVAFYSRHAAVAAGSTLAGCALALLVGVDRLEKRSRILGQLAGGVFLIAGAAVMARQSVGVATLVGLVFAVGLIALGATPGHAMLSLFGLLGLLIFVPWSISHYFPGSGSAPLLIFISGVMIVVVAVVLARMRGRFSEEFGSGVGASHCLGHGRASRAIQSRSSALK